MSGGPAGAHSLSLQEDSLHRDIGGLAVSRNSLFFVSQFVVYLSVCCFITQCFKSLFFYLFLSSLFFCLSVFLVLFLSLRLFFISQYVFYLSQLFFISFSLFSYISVCFFVSHMSAIR